MSIGQLYIAAAVHSEHFVSGHKVNLSTVELCTVLCPSSQQNDWNCVVNQKSNQDLSRNVQFTFTFSHCQLASCVET